MRRFFNAENWLWKPLGYLGELVMLSLLWTVFSFPVLTLGPASAALYDAAVHGIRRRDDPLLYRFFSTFRQELKTGVLSTLLCAAVVLAAAAFFTALAVLLPESETIWRALLITGCVLVFFFLCVLCWVWPTLSRFTLGPRALLVVSLRLAFGHILRSAAMALAWGAALYAGLRYIAPMFVCPALAALLSSLLIEPVFCLYETQSTPPQDEETVV